MTFILTKQGLFEGRVRDPDRGIELMSLGGGSSGVRRYRLVGQFDEKEFSGHTPPGAKLTQSQMVEGFKDLINWQIWATERPFRIGPNPEDTVSLRALIVEAMTRYGYAADKKKTDLVSVKFYSPKGVLG